MVFYLYTLRTPDGDLPHFKSFISGGVRASYVQPIFPSMSWACWTTVATGLTVERHGILSNYIWDRETGREFGVSWGEVADPFWWGQHVPIWISATEEGENGRKLNFFKIFINIYT